jgi:predicted transcriptional regulator
VRYRNLDAEMARYGITNKMLADAAGKSPESIDKKRSGKIDWKLSEVMAIKKTFFPDLSLNYLFEREGDTQ